MTNHDRVGYGNRFYKKRKSPLPYIFIVIALAAAFLIFNHIRTKNELEFQEFAKKEAARALVKPAVIEDDMDIMEEEGEWDTEDSDVPLTASSVPVPQKQSAPANIKNTKPRKTTRPLYTPANQTSLIKAGEYFAKGNYDKAVELYLEALPQNQSALVYTGMCYYWLKNYDNAIDYFNQAVEYNKMDFMARKCIAFSHYNLDDLDEAREAVKEALKIMKDNELNELQIKLLKEEINIK